MELHEKGITKDSFEVEDLYIRLADLYDEDDPNTAVVYLERALKVSLKFRNEESFTLGNLYLKLATVYSYIEEES